MSTRNTSENTRENTGENTRSITSRLTRHAPLAALLVLATVLYSFFFESFPNGWDQAEYALDIRDNYLPHSPYITYLLIGKLFSLAFDPPLALSMLSLSCALLSIGLLYGCCLRLDSGADAQRTGLFAAALFGGSFIVARHAGTQEVYTLQSAAALLALYISAGSSSRRGLLGGFAFGVALTVHSSCLFLAPAMVAALWANDDSRPERTRLTVGWAFAATGAATIGLIAIHLLMAYPDGEPKSVVFLEYVRGILPPFDTAQWSTVEFWAQSIAGVWTRLTASDVPMSRTPLGSGPTGLTAAHLVFATIGSWVALRSSWRHGMIWVLYPAGFIAYEVVFVPNVDFGLYIPQVMPSLCVLVALSARFATAPTDRGGLGRGHLVAVILCIVALAPSLRLAYQHRGQGLAEALEHFKPHTLAAIAMADRLPADAVVVQSASEWNVNILPFYSRRTPIIRSGRELRILSPRGPFIPMNATAFDTLTTESLTDLIQSGRPVYSFGPNPIGNHRTDQMEPARFAWKRAMQIDVSALIDSPQVPAWVRAGLRTRKYPLVTLHRAVLRR